MKLAKKVFAVAMVAFWAIMSNHCGLEMMPGFKFLACAPQTEAKPHGPSDCGSDKDVCATVEGGLYKSEDSQISAGQIPITPVFLLTVFSPILFLDSIAIPARPELTPPDLPHSWQFSFRTALPPRAPSNLA